MASPTSLNLAKIKTRFGKLFIPIAEFPGTFSSDYELNLSASFKPYSLGVSILADYDRISPFSTPRIYEGNIDNYQVEVAPLGIWGGRDSSIKVTALRTQYTFYLTSGNNGSNGRIAVPFLAIDSNNTIISFRLAPPESDFTVESRPTEETFGYAVSETWGISYGGRIGGYDSQIVLQSDFLHTFLVNESIDPYSGGGNTEPGGGEGDLDDSSDSINPSPLPTLSAVDAKFISLYTPSLLELQNLSGYMWSSLFDLDTLKKLFADPMKAILGLSIVPISVPSSGQQVISIGNILTGVSMTKAATQYITLDCGTLNVNEYWGAYLDYSPYTRLEIYLPYIGTKELNIDDVMGKACHLYYNIDILTGACCAMIKCGTSVLYSYAGQCATSIPITGSDWTNVINGTLSAALSTAGVIAGAITGSAPLSTIAGVSAVSSASQNVMQMKPIIEKSGSLAGSAGMLGVQKPYLILTRPRQALPENQNRFTGYPSYITVQLGDCIGVTFVENVHLENIPCTSAELTEIENLLKSGVIF